MAHGRGWRTLPRSQGVLFEKIPQNNGAVDVVTELDVDAHPFMPVLFQWLRTAVIASVANVEPLPPPPSLPHHPAAEVPDGFGPLDVSETLVTVMQRESNPAHRALQRQYAALARGMQHPKVLDLAQPVHSERIQYYLRPGTLTEVACLRHGNGGWLSFKGVVRVLGLHCVPGTPPPRPRGPCSPSRTTSRPCRWWRPPSSVDCTPSRPRARGTSSHGAVSRYDTSTVPLRPRTPTVTASPVVRRRCVGPPSSWPPCGSVPTPTTVPLDGILVWLPLCNRQKKNKDPGGGGAQGLTDMVQVLRQDLSE